MVPARTPGLRPFPFVRTYFRTRRPAPAGVEGLAQILVVDDEPDILVSLADLLRTRPDTRVETAGSYAEGRRKAAEQPWDLVISDERLPDGEGALLLAEV